jgi:hypothetical protein
MSSYGIETYDKIGAGITVGAGGDIEAKSGGITVDWASISAFGADAVFLNEDYVKAGEKFIRYGTVMCRIMAATDTSKIGKFVPHGTSVSGGTLASVGAGTARGNWYILNRSVHEEDRMSDHPEAIEGGSVYQSRVIFADGSDGYGYESQVVTLGAGNTGGTFTLTVGAYTTAAIAYNASAAAVKSALEALANVGTGGVTVTGAAGGPYTINFVGSQFYGVNVAAMTGTGSLTGGANTVTITDNSVAITALSGPSTADFLAAFPRIRFVNEN